MSFTPQPYQPSSDAHFTPTQGTYKELKPFRYWCQKVLPLVYDDSLSYYELLCKVVDYLNKTMEDVDTLHVDVDNLHDAYAELETDMNHKYTDISNWVNISYNDLVNFVNTYFDNLDVQEEINNKLDAMAESGELSALIVPLLPVPVDAWLSEHITNPTNPPLDTSLTLANAAAPAKTVGDNIKNMNTEIDNITGGNITFGQDIDTGTLNVKDLNYRAANPYNGCEVYKDKTGNIRIKGTATADFLAFALTDNAEYSIGDKIYIAVSGNITNHGSSVNLGVYAGSTVISNIIYLNTGNLNASGTLTVTQNETGYVYIYAAAGSNIDITIRLNDTTYHSIILGKHSKVINKGYITDNYHEFWLGDGDHSFLVNIGLDLDRLCSMPYIPNLLEAIDFDNGTITFNNHLAITPIHYFSLPNGVINYSVNEFIQYFVYNYETNTITVSEALNTSKHLCLFAIYYKQLITPYAYLYEKSKVFENIFSVSPVFSDNTNIQIDTNNGTITFTNCIFLVGNNFVNKGDITVEFTYQQSYAHYVYYDGTDIKVAIENAGSGYNVAFQKNRIPLFYFYMGKVYGIDPKVLVTYNGTVINGKNFFPIKGELIKNATVNIDTTNGTITINNCILLLGNKFVNKGNYTINFTYNSSYAHFIYYNGTDLECVVESPLSPSADNYNEAWQLNRIPLFYLYNGKIYNLEEEINVYLDGIQIHGNNNSTETILRTKKMAFLGDSITAGVGAGGESYAYPKWIADILQCTVVNEGLSGSAITNRGQATEGFIPRVSDIPSDCDVVAFMGGTNDYWQNVPLGTFGDTTDTTFYGALYVLITTLQNRFPNSLIYGVIPPMGYAPDNNFDMETKSNIGSFEDVAIAIRKVCEQFGIPVLDMKHCCSLNPKNSEIKSYYYSDGVHLKAVGEKILANMHIGFLKQYCRYYE